MAFFSLVTFLSVVDYYINRQLYAGEWFNERLDSIKPTIFRLSFGASFGTLLASCLFVIMDETVFRTSSPLLWSYFEGLILLTLSVGWTYVVFSTTSYNRFVNGVNNIYFGMWGTFLASINSFGSWLKESKTSFVTRAGQ